MSSTPTPAAPHRRPLGLFRAQPLVRVLLPDTGPVAGCDGPRQPVRVSLGAGTTTVHIDRLLRAVLELTG